MQSDTVEPDDVPEEIESITRGLASEHPPTNPIVVLKAARWWYLHGKGGSDPTFRWAIEWARHLATDTPSDVERFDDFLEYPLTVGFADERTNSGTREGGFCSPPRDAARPELTQSRTTRFGDYHGYDS